MADVTAVMTAECDRLLDEGEVYAAKLEAAGNKVVVKRFAGVPPSIPAHGRSAGPGPRVCSGHCRLHQECSGCQINSIV